MDFNQTKQEKLFLQMIREAANDPSVLSVRITIYRLASKAKLVEYLCAAAENGKDVLVLVELKARFDEENNIEWSRRLEEAGCSVIYGLDGYKVHSKLCLITRMEETGVAYYTQIGTGNYNEKTARLYTDLCLMTADHDIGEEANAVFNALAKGETVHETRRLLVAPHCLQNKVLAMMNDEIRRARAGLYVEGRRAVFHLVVVYVEHRGKIAALCRANVHQMLSFFRKTGRAVRHFRRFPDHLRPCRRAAPEIRPCAAPATSL